MRKSFSILLSVILLAGQMSVAIGTHFCGGEAVESKIIWGETHLGCGMMDMEEPCDDAEKSNTNELHFDKIPCCENEYHTVQATNEFVKDAAQTTFNVEFAVAFIYTTLNLDLFPESTHQFYSDYSPPPLEKDISVLFQTFLI
ncbi:MAG: hypothetical protein P1P82_17195 [Bacteroidales bacterium]|nr:hypothetical protein [Bacteroidales bacterium]